MINLAAVLDFFRKPSEKVFAGIFLGGTSGIFFSAKKKRSVKVLNTLMGSIAFSMPP
jgi:hypothetical protein